MRSCPRGHRRSVDRGAHRPAIEPRKYPHPGCRRRSGDGRQHGIARQSGWGWRFSLDETRRPSGFIIDAGGGLGKALIDAERQSVFAVLCFIDCRVGWWSAATALSVEGLAAAIALDIHLEDRCMMDQAIDGGERHGLVGEDLAPFAKWLICRDQHGSALVTCGDQPDTYAGFGLIFCDVGDV